MYPGWFQEDHWAVHWSDDWKPADGERFVFGHAMMTDVPGASAWFLFAGTDLRLSVMRHPEGGLLTVRVDNRTRTFDLHSTIYEVPFMLSVAHGLPDGQHYAEIVNTSGRNAIDGFIVRRTPARTWLMIAVIVGVLAAVWGIARRPSKPFALSAPPLRSLR